MKTLFSSVAFRAADSGAAEVTDWLWPFIGVALALTVSVIVSWYFGRNMGRWRGLLEARKERRGLRSTMSKDELAV